MKKILLLFVTLIFATTSKAQSLNIYVGSTGCFPSSPTASVVVTQSVSGATSYSWSSSFLSGCTNTFNTFSNGLFGGVTYGCCGSHTIICTALNASMVPIASTATVMNVACTPTLSISMSPATVCPGQYFTLSASGANSYTWTRSPGQNISYSSTATDNPIVATCYTVRGINSNGCIGTAVKCVTPQLSPNVTISGSSNICLGDTLILTANGASSYTWSNGSNGNAIYLSPSASGCYSVAGTATSGCTSYAVKCVTVSNGPTITGPSAICAGSFAILHASGGTSYSWAPGGMSSSSVVVYPTSTTCYTLFASGGCGGAAVKCVSVSPQPTLSLTVFGGSCAGQSRTLTVSGASSYTWYPSLSNASSIVISPTASICYSVVGTNGSGCTSSTGTCLTVQPANVNIFGPSSVCSGNSAVLTVTAAGSYTWLPTGSTGSSITITPSVSTCYTVIGNLGGCFASAVKCVTVGSPPSLSVNFPSVVCAGTFPYISASGASSYTWLPFNVTSNAFYAQISGPGCYTVIGSSNGCTGFATGCWSVIPSPTVTISGNTVVCGGSSTTLTASGANSYTWYPSNMTGSVIVISPSVTTCFSVSAMSGNCYGYSSRCVIVQNSNISVSGPNSICSGQSATLSASGSSSYTWQPGNLVGSSIVVSPTASTCYTVTGLTGTNSSCSSSAVKCVSVNPYPNITTGSSGFCAGQQGQIFASGASTYTWYPFNMTGSLVTISPTVSGCYTVVGTNASGCMSSAFGCYSVFPSPSVSVSGPTVICPNSSATLVASGASSYTWMPGGLTGSVIVVSPSVTTCYTVMAKNQAGCTAFAAKCISIQNGTLSINGPNAVCSGASVTLTATGATSYTWQPGNITGASIVVSPSSASCYTVTGTIAGGNCMASAVKCLGVGSTPTITTTSGVFCAGRNAVFFAQGASSYTWIPFGVAGHSAVITPTTGGCYTVIGTNSTGCIGSAVGCYSVIPAPSVTITGNSFLCPGDTAVLTASGGNSYTWIPGGSTGPSLFVTPMSSTCYTVIASNGVCTSAGVKCIQVNSTPSVSIAGSNFACLGNPYVLVASGANSYQWSNGATTPSIVVTPTASGCFTVTGSNGPNCSSSAVKCFSVINSVSLTIGGVHNICRGQLANITVTGANTYQWNTGSQASVLFVSPPFTSVYTVTGSIGSCSQVRTVQVTVSQGPTITIAAQPSVLCRGMSATLTASGANSYFWPSTGDSVATIAVNPTVTSGFVVNGYNSQGCPGAATITVFVDQCTGLASTANKGKALEIYPNPAVDAITLKSGTETPVRFTLYDMLGRRLASGDFTGTTTIDVSHFAAGSYIVELAGGGKLQHARLIVER